MTRRWRAGQVTKRGFDIVAALTLLVVLSPALALGAAAVRLSSPGSVLFRQTRIGRHGRLFRIVKFRTMTVDAEELLSSDTSLHSRYVSLDFKLPLEDDPRVTRIGRTLRRTYLDELPQLWNVLVGEMSLVGPRPVLVSELDRYGDWRWAYDRVRPGLTGAWQVGPLPREPYPARARIDAEYVASWSLVRDIGILTRTPHAVFRGFSAITRP